MLRPTSRCGGAGLAGWLAGGWLVSLCCCTATGELSSRNVTRSFALPRVDSQLLLARAHKANEKEGDPALGIDGDLFPVRPRQPSTRGRCRNVRFCSNANRDGRDAGAGACIHERASLGDVRKRESRWCTVKKTERDRRITLGCFRA